METNNIKSLGDDIRDMSFEDAMKELEITVNKLEEGNLNLEESIALFEKGQVLAAYCSKRLDQALLKVEQLTADGEIIDLST